MSGWAAVGKIAGDIGGTWLNYSLQKKADADARREQYWKDKEFAQHGVRWRVEDARKAGLHPLAALGISPAQGSTAFAGDHTSAHGGLSEGLSQLGSKFDKKDPYTEKLKKLDLRKKNLELRILEKELENMGVGEGPRTDSLGNLITDSKGNLTGMDSQRINGESDPSVKRIVPEKAVIHGNREGGIGAGEQWLNMGDGSYKSTYSQTGSEPMESSIQDKINVEGKRIWNQFKNEFYVKFHKAKGAEATFQRIRDDMPRQSPGKGKEWRYDHIWDDWYPVKKGTGGSWSRLLYRDTKLDYVGQNTTKVIRPKYRKPKRPSKAQRRINFEGRKKYFERVFK